MGILCVCFFVFVVCVGGVVFWWGCLVDWYVLVFLVFLLFGGGVVGLSILGIEILRCFLKRGVWVEIWGCG